jgi:hypothetical protein
MLSEANKLSSGSKGFSHRHKEGLLSAISIGFFLILVGTLFVLNPDLPNKIIDLARPENFELKTVAPGLNVSLPIPKNPRAHLLIYQTVEQFCLVWAVFLVGVLGVRFIFGSPARRKAEGLGNAVFWFGAAYLVQTLLVDTTKWFEFWATITALIGVSLIVRGIFLVAAWKTRMG